MGSRHDLDDAGYLRGLTEALMQVPAYLGIDGGDVDRVSDIAHRMAPVGTGINTTRKVVDVIAGAKFGGPPEWAGNVVAMTKASEVIFIACEHAVFKVVYCRDEDGGDYLVPLRFAEAPL